MPTAFVARAGKGEPVVAFLAEYDALPELSQAGGATKKQPVQAGAPGHGCGHNLLGTAAVAAAVAANRARAAERLGGTIAVYGTPAEELLLGKVFMARDGAFKDVGAVLSWHPGAENQVVNRVRLALSAMDVEFFGKTAHAAANPWLGRGALDAVELLDHAMALMREHIRPTARMHRTVKSGGSAPNIISDYAKVQWWVRDANAAGMEDLAARVRKAAEGVALATETRAKVTLLAQTRDPVPNEALDRVVQRVPGHHWAVTSCALHPIGFKGMGVASKVLAASAVDLLKDPALVRSAGEELARATGGKPYRSPLPPDARPAAY